MKMKLVLSHTPKIRGVKRDDRMKLHKLDKLLKKYRWILKILKIVQFQ
jgi:hypothetical protein